jgi:glycosyltransferase involved in cell wall biosynthesis
MKFAVVCTHYGYIKRGTENMTHDINKVLLKRGHEIDVFSLGQGSGIIHVDGLRKDKGLGKFSDKLAERTMLGGFMRKYIGPTPHIEDLVFSLNFKPTFSSVHNNYDLIWCNGEYWETLMCNKLAQAFDKPVLSFFGGGISAMMKKEAELLPDIFVVLTPEMTEWVQGKVPDCNVKCIPSGVDLRLFDTKVKPLFTPLKYEHPIVVSTSALIESKRIDLTIEAMAQLGKGTMFMTSDGPLRDTLVTKGKKLLGNRFNYLGVIPFEDLPRLYAMADAFVMSSRNEPYGLTIFESMATNTPIVAQRDRTREWMVGEGGILIDDCTKIDQFANALDQLHTIDFGDKPRKQAEKFSWETTVDLYEKAIEEIQN